MIYEHTPKRQFATVNTLARDYHQYVTGLDVVVDKVALEHGELSRTEAVQLVNFLAETAFAGRERGTVQS